MKLYNKILIGLFAGVACGAIANFGNLGGLKSVLGYLEPVGTAFIRLITMIVIPLVIASLMVGAASLGDLGKLGRIGGKTLFYYTLTTVAAVSLDRRRATRGGQHDTAAGRIGERVAPRSAMLGG